MGSDAVDHTVVQHDNLIRILYGRDTLGNDDLGVSGISSRKAFRIMASVWVSTALVESSSIRILGFFNSALAIHSLCF